MSRLLSQVGVIHGAGIDIQGTVTAMTPGTQANAETALELLTEGLIDRVICSGRGPLENMAYESSEAGLMADYLFRHGVRTKSIDVEDQSTTAIGNWALSAEIIKDLGAETVLGITAKPDIRRMRKIGKFVSQRADFELIDYWSSHAPAGIKDYVRESGMYILTGMFLDNNLDTPLPELEAAYIAFKNDTGVGALKRLVHRRSAWAQEA